jgi:hypothetical protein
MLEHHRPSTSEEAKKSSLSYRFEKLFDKEDLRPIKKEIAKVFDQRYRMTNFYEDELPRVNIIISWLLIFMASLKY